MKKSIVFGFVLLFSQIAFSQYDADAKVLLDKVSKKFKSLNAYSATFVNTINSPLADINESTKGEAIISGTRFKIKLEGQELVCDGKTLYTFLKEINEVNISQYEPEESEINPTNIYSIYQNGYKYTSVGDETIGNKTYKIVELNPEDVNNPFFKVKIWIDESSSTIKRWKIFEKNGNRYTYEISNFKENIQVSDETFKFNKDQFPGVEVVDLR